MLIFLLPGLLLLTLFVSKSFSTSTNAVTGTKQFTTHLPHCIISNFLTFTIHFEMTSPFYHNVLQYKVGHTVPPYGSRFMGCNYRSWTHVRAALSYGSLNHMSAGCCTRVVCCQMVSEISTGIMARFMTAGLCGCCNKLQSSTNSWNLLKMMVH
jgi:hypothetical protein